MLNSKQRAELRALANSISPIIHVGKQGVNPLLTENLAEALEKRELVKITVLDNCDEDVNDIANILAERTRAQIIQVIGRKIIIYKRSKNNQKLFVKEKKK